MDNGQEPDHKYDIGDIIETGVYRERHILVENIKYNTQNKEWQYEYRILQTGKTNACGIYLIDNRSEYKKVA